jgi:hypothetical protein
MDTRTDDQLDMEYRAAQRHSPTHGNLRDQFAMAALTGLIAHGADQPYYSHGREIEGGLAGVSYHIADAMLEARKQR